MRSSISLKSLALGISIATMSFSVFANDMTIDFSESQSFPTSANTVQVNHVRLDTKVPNPFDPNRPQILTTYVDVPFRFYI